MIIEFDQWTETVTETEIITGVRGQYLGVRVIIRDLIIKIGRSYFD